MTLPSQTAPSTLLSPSSYAVVSATAPVVAQHADEITARFYANMFAAHPELLRVFNKGNQATGEQSKALAGSVVAYAVQLIDPNAPSFAHVMRRIAYKHMSLGIRAEQYIVVGIICSRRWLRSSVRRSLPTWRRPGRRSIGCLRLS
jgi:nitric oxide dioxygenase